jgi:hypothetical protein
MKRSAVAVLALAVLVAVWVYHRDHAGLRASRVSTTMTIPLIGTWAPPPPGAAPAMTPVQAWVKWSHLGVAILPATVQLGLITSRWSQNELAYGYYGGSCPAGSTAVPPATECWMFLDANTGHSIIGTFP